MMNKEEITKFLSKIKKDYPNFSINSDEYAAWEEVLSRTTLEQAELRYQHHKDSEEFKNQIPNIKLFMGKKHDSEEWKYLRTCNFCGCILYSKAMDLHEDRHRSVNYIVRRYRDYWHQEMSKQKYQELMDMDQEEFDNKYNEFLKKVYEITPLDWERRNIRNILYLNEHPGETLPLEF